MKKLLSIIALAISLASCGQVPSIGGMQYNKIIPGGSGWDISSPSVTYTFYDSMYSFIGPIFFSADGTRLFIVNISGTRYIYSYTLSVPFSLASATYDVNYYNVGTYATYPYGMFFKNDGTRFFICNYINDRVLQFTLSTAWDVSTATYSSYVSVTSQASVPRSLTFSDDGVYMFVADDNSNNIFRYELSTPWDVTTASYSGNYLYIGDYIGTTRGIYISPDGLNIYAVEYNSPQVVSRFTLTTANDLSTASFYSDYTIVTPYNYTGGLFFSSDGTKMYISYNYNYIDEYNL